MSGASAAPGAAARPEAGRVQMRAREAVGEPDRPPAGSLFVQERALPLHRKFILQSRHAEAPITPTRPPITRR